MAFNKINFSAEAEKDLIPAWKDYVNHYRKGGAMDGMILKQAAIDDIEYELEMINLALDSAIKRP